MTRDEFNKMRGKLLDEARLITKTKGEDYTKGNEDVLINLKEGKAFGLTSLQTCGVFMKKHIDAIYSYIKTGGQSESEPIRERIKDSINYLILLNGLIEESELTNYGYSTENDYLYPREGETGVMITDKS